MMPFKKPNNHGHQDHQDDTDKAKDGHNHDTGESADPDADADADPIDQQRLDEQCQVLLTRLASTASTATSTSSSDMETASVGSSTLSGGRMLERLILASPQRSQSATELQQVIRQLADRAAVLMEDEGRDGDISGVIRSALGEGQARRSIRQEVRRVRDVDCAFLVDITESMGRFIWAVSKYIWSIVGTIKKR